MPVVHSIGDTPLPDWEWTIGINLWGVIHGCHVFTPTLREAGYGGIINVASAASFGAAPRMAAYNVSKAGVLALSETLSAELSGTGVHVSVLCPTFVKTNILNSDRITGRAPELAATLMRSTGLSAARVARTTLNTHDRGGLYVMPQLDAKVVWAIKRHAPRAYTRGAGLLDVRPAERVRHLNADGLLRARRKGTDAMAMDMEAMLAKIKDSPVGAGRHRLGRPRRWRRSAKSSGRS